MKVIGLFDGDQRGLRQSFNWPYTFLPGESAPEVQLRKAATIHIEKTAEKLNKELDEIHRIFSTIEGLDHHDWLEEFYKRSGLEYNQLMKGLFKVYLIEYEDIAKQSFETLITLLQE